MYLLREIKTKIKVIWHIGETFLLEWVPKRSKRRISDATLNWIVDRTIVKQKHIYTELNEQTRLFTFSIDTYHVYWDASHFFFGKKFRKSQSRWWDLRSLYSTRQSRRNLSNVSIDNNVEKLNSFTLFC